MITRPDKSTSSHIESFRHNDKVYEHVIFCSDDDRVELKDREGNCVLIFDNSCGIHLPDRKTQIGKIILRDDFWISEVYGQPHLMDRDLLKLEVMVSKQYLETIHDKN